jgi:hypothetical protein
VSGTASRSSQRRLEHAALPDLVRRRIDGHIPEEDWPTVGEASRAAVREIKQAGAWIFGGGVMRHQASIVATDGSVTDGPVPETKSVIGGFSIIEVTSHEEALAWAAKLAKSCRCAQEVREIGYDPES